MAGDMEGVVQRDALRSHCSNVRNSSPCVTLPMSSRSAMRKNKYLGLVNFQLRPVNYRTSFFLSSSK